MTSSKLMFMVFETDDYGTLVGAYEPYVKSGVKCSVRKIVTYDVTDKIKTEIKATNQ